MKLMMEPPLIISYPSNYYSSSTQAYDLVAEVVDNSFPELRDLTL